MCHGGPLFLVSPGEAPSSLGCSVAALNLSPLSQDPIEWRMKRPVVVTSTGIQCRRCLAVQLLSPGRRSALCHASEQKESMTAWWYAVIQIMKRGDNIHHPDDCTSVLC